jgi:outer membrane protein assembly factor BamB
MCSESTEGDETRTWCGSGWTGEPAVFEREGRTWVVFGAYDRAVHFVDAATGQDIRPPFPTGDIIKGSVTVDPDGFPLVYTGSRDDKYRVLAIDRNPVEELYALNATDVSPTMWNNDWDGSGLVIDDHLFEGGENSQFHVVKLNRAGGSGEGDPVTVAPQLVFNTPGWDDELLANIGDSMVSIESSVAISGNTAYFANSGGLVQGWDIGPLREGGAGAGAVTRTFRFWTGDDTDASVVVDDEGMLYVASEYERATPRSLEVGQIMKLDPTNAEDPLVWSVPDHDANPAGVWATPAIHEDMVYVPTNGGRLLGIDRATGEVRWTKELPGPTWQSPVVVDDVLIQGDCNGFLHAYDVSDTTVDPPELWTVELGGCIESTPAVWHGQIFVGTRAGQFFAIADP